MKTTLSVYDFRDAFRKAGRAEQFSYDGLEILFDYLEQYEEDTGSDYELDVIGICCDYAEDSAENIAKAYRLDIPDDGNEHNNVLDYLHDEGVLIGTSESGIVYRQF
jgi:hypothetical protein